jgi:hypothetical protein
MATFITTPTHKHIIPLSPGPYYPLGTIDTIPRAYDIFRTYEEMEGRTNKNKGIKNRKI